MMSNNTADNGKTVSAELRYVTKPNESQEKRIRDFIKSRTRAREVELKLVEDKSIIGGFILTIGSLVFDWSNSGRTGQFDKLIESVLQKTQYDEKDLLDILKAEVNDFELHTKYNEVGTVEFVGDGIALLSGIEHAEYGEVIVFDDGTRGMVQNIDTDNVGCILFGREQAIREGMRCARTGKRAGIPVGDAFLGRVVNALGDPIDGLDPIKAVSHRPIEFPAPGIVDRESVKQPLETGILAIDSMFPIGKGQRELIIGDRQTGKTSIAIDAIINQRGKDVKCLYVAIGQKASTVARIVNTLRRTKALDYTVVVSATASDPASLQYIAPYSATAIAEQFMYKGNDVLIVYDDLSKHAVAYRSISLLLGRPPGREAYPGDVFYLHSRLLERSSRLSKDLGGGSITALPIIETQAGDVSDYIPTNVISITDGQIFLETDLFFEGQRPAVNVGLSVSRVGGAAQSRAMKAAVGSMRIDLAQYREMAVFTQFSSDLDPSTKRMLTHGEALMELLKQPLEDPLSLSEEVVALTAANNDIMDDIDRKKIGEFRRALLNHMKKVHGDVLKTIEQRQALDMELLEQILRFSREFKKDYLEGKQK